MKNIKSINILFLSCLIPFVYACSTSGGVKDDIAGKYASTGENEYDLYKDTMEVKANDDEKFDVQIIATWSAAKKDDPERPNKNKKAGVWNNYGSDPVEVATFQASDTTLRIAEPVTGKIKIFNVNTEKKTITQTLPDGSKNVYTKISD